MSKFVYNLIHSLSSREIAYFKRSATLYSSESDKNYMKVFDELRRMACYDKNGLLIKFKDEKFVNHLSSELKYLEEKILLSLANYNLNNSSRSKLQKEIFKINVLIEKGFKTHALKILKKSKNIAYEHEFFTGIMMLISLEEELIFKEGIYGYKAKLERLHEERRTIINKIYNLNQLRLLREHLRELQFSFDYISKESEQFKEFDNPLITNQELVLSKRGMEHWYYLNDLKYYLTREFDKMKVVCDQLLDFMEQNPKVIKKSRLLAAISNNIYCCALLKDKTSFENVHRKLQKLTKDKTLDQAYIQYISYTRRLELYYRLDDVDMSFELFKEFKSILVKIKNKLEVGQLNYSYLILVRTAIFTERHESSIELLNAWAEIGVLDFTLVYNRLFSLIIHQKLGWFDLMHSEINSTIKLIKSHGLYDDMVSTMINYFKNSLKGGQHVDIAKGKLIEKLSNLKSDPLKNRHFERYDFLSWAMKSSEI